MPDKPTDSTPMDFIGQGEFPDEFDRVNFGAYGFGCIWALLYGPTAWLIAMISVVVARIVIDNIALVFFDSGTVFPAVQRITEPAADFALATLFTIYALKVNRLVWERERATFTLNPEGPDSPLPYWRYRKSVRFWTRLFVGLLFVTLTLTLGAAVFGVIEWRDLRWSWLPLVPTVGLFVYDRIRQRAKAKLTSAST